LTIDGFVNQYVNRTSSIVNFIDVYSSRVISTIVRRNPSFVNRR
jgi:hypothetical protein